jgi:glycerol dehydrogenase
MGFKTKIFGAPSRYVQGAGAIQALGRHIALLGDKVLVVGGKAGLSATREGREKSFKLLNILQIEDKFNGESSDEEIARLAAFGIRAGVSVLMASGGGKAIDAVKAAAEDMNVPAVIVPTIASNDAPCSALSVIYNNDGSFSRLRPLKNNPALVLMDTEIIAKAPVRTLVAGMGDALATWFEADACRRSNALNSFGGSVSEAGLALAKHCLNTIIEHGFNAKIACENQVVTHALEKVVEANTLLSGLGFENGGVAVAHALSEAFSAVPELHHAAHGETVAFGLLVQLILEDRPTAEINEIYEFCRSVGLPITLGDLGCEEIDKDTLRRAADAAAAPGNPSANMPFPVTGRMLYDAVRAADGLGRSFSAAK